MTNDESERRQLAEQIVKDYLERLVAEGRGRVDTDPVSGEERFIDYADCDRLVAEGKARKWIDAFGVPHYRMHYADN
jgi:hypothetical protein